MRRRGEKGRRDSAGGAGNEATWKREGWNEKCDRADPPTSDRGRGHTSEEVAAFRPPDGDTRIAYYRSVRAHSAAFLDGLTEADLNRPVPNLAGDGTPPMRERFELSPMDTLHPSGQIAYLRGLIKGKGWLPS